MGWPVLDIRLCGQGYTKEGGSIQCYYCWIFYRGRVGGTGRKEGGHDLSYRVRVPTGRDRRRGNWNTENDGGEHEARCKLCFACPYEMNAYAILTTVTTTSTYSVASCN